MHDLILSKYVCRGNARARSAYIEGFGEFHKLYAGSVLTPQEDRNLKANSGKTALF